MPPWKYESICDKKKKLTPEDFLASAFVEDQEALENFVKAAVDNDLDDDDCAGETFSFLCLPTLKYLRLCPILSQLFLFQELLRCADVKAHYFVDEEQSL